MSIAYVHTNIVAEDWNKLAQFYIDAFDCTTIYPERDMSGNWIDKMTNIPAVHIKGIHLALPGTDGKQTLEIFSYNKERDSDNLPAINEKGFAHIAFRVDDVHVMIDRVLMNGGTYYGQIIEKTIEHVGRLTAVYMRDPENNIVEIQNLEKENAVQ